MWLMSCDAFNNFWSKYILYTNRKHQFTTFKSAALLWQNFLTFNIFVTKKKSLSKKREMAFFYFSFVLSALYIFCCKLYNMWIEYEINSILIHTVTKITRNNVQNKLFLKNKIFVCLSVLPEAFFLSVWTRNN